MYIPVDEVTRKIRLSWGAQPWRKVWLPKGPPVGKFSRQTPRTFHCFSDFWIKTVKIMRPRVSLGLLLNIFQSYLGGSLMVLNSGFTGVILKSVQSLTKNIIPQNFLGDLNVVARPLYIPTLNCILNLLQLDLLSWGFSRYPCYYA